MQSTSPSSASVAEPSLDPSHSGIVARNALFLLMGQVVSTLLSIALSAALGRTLGPADFGVYFLILTMATFVFVVVDWGQIALVVREGARAPESLGPLLGNSLAFRAGAGVLAALATTGVAHLLGYGDRVSWLAGLMVLCMLPFALSQSFGYVFRSQNRMDLDSGVTLTSKALTVLCTLAVLALGGHLFGVVLAQAVGGVGALLVGGLLARNAGLPRPRASWAGVQELAHQGSSLAVFLVAMAVEPYIGAIILSKLAPAPVVGWYGAARNIIGVLLAPANILAGAAFPQIARAVSTPAELRRVVRLAIRPLCAIAALGAAGTFLFADVGVSVVYSKGKFGPAATVLQLFAPTLFLYFFDMLLAYVSVAAGRTRALAVAKLASVATSTALALWLVPLCQARLGNGGVGLVSSIGLSELVMMAGCLLVLPQGALDRATLLDVGRAAVAGALTVLLFHFLPAITPWVAIPACVTVFSLLAMALRLVSPSEIARLVPRT